MRIRFLVLVVCFKGKSQSAGEEIRSELEAKLASLRVKYKLVKGEAKELQAVC